MPATPATPHAAPLRQRVLRALWQAAWQYRGRTLAALALLIAAKLAAVSVPLLLKAVVDRFSRPESMARSVEPAAAPPGVEVALVVPVVLLVGYAALRFAGTLFTELRDLVFARVTQRTVTGFAERAFAHLLALGPRFHTRRSTGMLIRSVERGTAGIAFLLGAGLFTVVPTLVEFGAVVAVMASGYSLWFTLIIMLTFFVYAGLTMSLTQTRAVRQRRVNELDSRAHGRLVDSLLNYEAVKAYAREGWERQRYAADLAAWVEGSVANQRSLSRLHIAQSAVIAFGVAGVMLLAAEQTVSGAMSVGDLVLVNAYVIQICLPLNALGFVFREAKDALVNTEQLFALLDERGDVQETHALPPLAVQGARIVFDRVSFGYEAGRQILDGVSLVIEPGQTVAVVGGSGSGKSTLARLLLRLYDPDSGRITIDGQDLRGVDSASLRQAIGLVPQDTVLFNDTIAANIGYGRSGAGLAEVVQAAQAAQVHEFIQSLPQQYDTVVGERGLALSGGEKQRVAIARAFLKNPPIMIFDEATSALDTRAERAIQGELDRIAQGRSTLIIAHRLSTIVNADQIVVLDKGRIVEQGRHDALLAHGGLYAQLWNLQRQQQQVEQLESRLARRPLNLVPLVESVVQGLRAAFEPRGVAIEAALDSLPGARIAADPSALAQVLWTLGSAALDATPAGGRIGWVLSRAGPFARLVLTDGRHAAGASPRADSGADHAAGHADPGAEPPMDPMQLRAIVERQGGRFAIEPATDGGGMRFIVELPLHALADVPAADAAPAERAADADVHGTANDPGSEAAAAATAAAMPAPDGPAGAAPLAGAHVAVVEDDDDARDALAALLRAEGGVVTAFATGRDTLRWLQGQPPEGWPEVLLCDIGLADEDGHDVVRALRQLELARGAAQPLPAVALTGLAGEDDRRRALDAGFQQHLGKPVPPAQLLAELQRLTRRG